VRHPAAVVATGLLGLVAGACGDEGGSTQVVGTTVAGATAVVVEATDFAFDPDRLELPAGEPVNLTLRVDEGGHNLRIEGTDFQLPIVEEGDAAVGTVTIADPGEYRMLCTVPGHEAAGMVASVVVG
jgi:plastocyanin